jgi:hypothetical protein
MIHIIEPIADQSLRFVIGRLGLSGLMEEIQIVSDFREVSKATDDNKNAKLIDYRVRAKLNPSVNPNNNKWDGYKTAIDLGNGNAIVRQEDVTRKKRPWTGNDFTGRDYSIFHDENLFVDITEWNVGSTLSMEVKMDFHDLTPAQDALSAIFATFTNGDMVGYVPIQYDYPIPEDIQLVLKKIYWMSDMEKTNEAYADWLNKKSIGFLSWNTNRNNINVRELVGLKNNTQALFLIECSQDQPEVGNNRFTVNFNLTVQYSRTNRLIMDYPIIINNKLLPFDYVPCTKEERQMNRGPFMWQNSAVNLYWHQQYKNDNPIPAMYPWWDKWELPYHSIIAKKGFRPIFIAAITLDDVDDPKGSTILDLKEGLPGYTLRDDLLQMLATSKERALHFAGTYINVAVFAHDYQVNPNLVKFDGRYLKLLSRQKESIYRLVISVDPYPDNLKGIPEFVWDDSILKQKGN